MINQELDDSLQFFIGLSLQLRTSHDQVSYIQNLMNNSSYETEYKFFFNYYYVDAYNELIINLSLIYDNDSRVRFNFFKYFNEYLKEIDVEKTQDGIMGYEKLDDVKSRLISEKKELQSYEKLITEYRSKNVAHVDKQSFDKIIELSKLERPILKFFDIVHSIAYYKFKYFPMYSFTYLSELEEMMKLLQKKQ
ncbi:MAG: hypothetical protein RG740_02065 [Acholeplasmataceae bacterium]|nr:hypothetical protein [Acholeplasmataceae bacterium]